MNDKRSRMDFQEKGKRIIHLLLPLLKVENDEFVIRKTTFGESQADTIGVGRTASAIQSKRRHFGGVQYFRYKS